MSKTETVEDDDPSVQSARGPLDRLYRLYSPWLTARIRRRFGWDAEDAVQEAWLWITPMSAVSEIRHPRALLLKVASNIAITRARQARRRAELDRTRPEAAVIFGADQAETVLLRQVILGLPQPLRDLGVSNRFDPTENLSGGADYLARQLLRFGDVRLALAAYNAGPGRVARLGRVPDIAETRAYVTAVVDCYLALTAGRGARNARQCRSEEARP